MLQRQQYLASLPVLGWQGWPGAARCLWSGSGTDMRVILAQPRGFCAGVVRAIASLVALPLDEVIALEKALREKLTELIGLLKEMAELIAA